MLNFEKYVDEFKKEIKNKYFNNATTLDVDNIEIFKLALKLGYRDAQRTFIKINERVWSKARVKDEFYNKFSVELQNLFKNKTVFSPEVLFDDFIKFFQNYGYKTTYGQAQKVINMTFKYLYCLDDKKKYKDIFDKCHMPLDSYTLEWYKRHIYPTGKSKDFKITSNDKWSNMDSQKYQAIVKDIKFHLQHTSITINGVKEDLPQVPLEAEFIIWQEEIMNQTVANFNKAIDKKYNKTDDYRKMLNDTEKYINQLKR